MSGRVGLCSTATDCSFAVGRGGILSTTAAGDVASESGPVVHFSAPRPNTAISSASPPRGAPRNRDIKFRYRADGVPETNMLASVTPLGERAFLPTGHAADAKKVLQVTVDRERRFELALRQ